MDPILVHPEPVPPELARALDLGGWSWKAVADIDEARRSQPADGWAGAIVVTDTSPDRSVDEQLRFCRLIRGADFAVSPILVLVGGAHLNDLQAHGDQFDDFCLHPFQPVELEARLKHLFSRVGHDTSPQLIEHGPLLMNLETYQAMIDQRPLDLTYMEYELLKFLAAHPGKVFSREALLSRVWGYDYYGGARTVDVHIRRLRAKLGEQHAGLIQTVRSVGYSFGKSRWGA